MRICVGYRGGDACIGSSVSLSIKLNREGGALREDLKVVAS